jgi:hypothetical protein
MVLGFHHLHVIGLQEIAYAAGAQSDTQQSATVARDRKVRAASADWFWASITSMSLACRTSHKDIT